MVIGAAKIVMDFSCPSSEVLFSSLDFIKDIIYSHWLFPNSVGQVSRDLGMEHSQ